MTLRAFRQIVASRVFAEGRTIALAGVLAFIVGFIQPHGIERIADSLSAELATRSVWLAGPMFFCSALGLALAFMQSPGRLAYLDACERGAPLFGRELARAKGAAAAVAATIATLCYWLAQYLTGFAMPPAFFTLALACVIATTLVALGATLRRGAARLIYIIVAFAVTFVAYAFAVYADAATTKTGDAIGVASELIFCGLCAFIALRQYGEALARYEPLETQFPRSEETFRFDPYAG